MPYAMKYFLSLLLLGSAISLHTAETIRHSIPEYYWKDYTGSIPSDAIIGGTAFNGENTYIGQMSLPNNKHLPGTITRGQLGVEGVEGDYGNGRIVKSKNNSNAKILCSRNPARYKWSTNSTIETDCYYVVVGQEDSIPLYVGQFTYYNRTLSGKVFSEYSGSENLKYAFVPYGDIILAFSSYATLIYCS